jgi:hypothetical protein
MEAKQCSLNAELYLGFEKSSEIHQQYILSSAKFLATLWMLKHKHRTYMIPHITFHCIIYSIFMCDYFILHAAGLAVLNGIQI